MNHLKLYNIIRNEDKDTAQIDHLLIEFLGFSFNFLVEHAT